jgi:hypothetical protein
MLLMRVSRVAWAGFVAAAVVAAIAASGFNDAVS